MSRYKFAIIAALLALFAFSATTAMADTTQLNLHNDRADVGTDCPSTGTYWHFVIRPNSGSAFISLHLNVGGTFYDFNVPGDHVILNNGQLDNLFVEVPAGKTLTDLSVSGSYAITTGGSGFNLSHVCGETTTPESSVDVVKTADTSWTVNCDWTIDKSGPDSVSVPDGGSATIDYNIVVDGACTQAINVSGSITVTNSGEDDVTVTSVSDELGGSLDCTPVVNNTVLAPNDSIVCSYSIDLDSATDTVNVATADWTDPDSGTHSTDSDPVNVDFPDQPVVTNGCVSVVDDTTGETLADSLCYDPDTLSAHAEYPVSTTVDQSDCGSVTNTASVYDEDDNQLDTDSVTTSVACLGKTMGFWGNRNGQARIIANGGYSANAVAIGRGSNIDTQAESLKVLPNTLNACGKGTPFIFAVGAQTATANCKLATGININSLNTNSAQTLALGYNIKLVSGYSGQTIGNLGCSASLTAGLTASSTVNDAFNAAVNLINGSSLGGTTTQAQLGAMNSLLGCLNREA